MSTASIATILLGQTEELFFVLLFLSEIPLHQMITFVKKAISRPRKHAFPKKH